MLRKLITSDKEAVCEGGVYYVKQRNKFGGDLCVFQSN